MTNTNYATILVKKPGLIIDDKMLKLASTKCPSSFGFAGIENGEIKLEVLPKAITEAELKALQEAFKDDHLVLYFRNHSTPETVHDDTMPWSMADAEGKPMVALFFEGHAKDYEGLQEGHSGEYCASDEIVFPRLTKAWTDSGEDVEKFIEELKKPGLQKVLMSIFEERGVYVMLTPKGIIAFGDNKLGGDFSWGSTSNTHGYTENAAAPVTAKEVVKSGLGFLRGRGTSASTTPAPEVPVEPAQPGVTPAPDKEGKPSVPAFPGSPKHPTPDELKAKGWKQMASPPKITGKARNRWLRVFNCLEPGELPANHESASCTVWVEPELIGLAQRTAASTKEVENIATGVHKIRKARKEPEHPVKSAETEAEKKAKETAEQAAAVLKGEQKPVTVEKKQSTVREHFEQAVANNKSNANGTSMFTPTMSDADKEKAMNKMAGYLDPKNTKRPSPLEIQAGESKHATFSESVACDKNDLLFIPVAQLHDLFDGNKIAVAMVVELRSRLIKEGNIRLEDLVLSGQQKPEKEEETVSPQPEPQPEPQKAPEVAPKKSGALGFLRGKQAA